MKFSPFARVARKNSIAFFSRFTPGFLLLFLFCSEGLFANNINITNPRLAGQNIKNKTVTIEFDLSWENSFRISNGPSNWDAVWVFVKYRVAKASGGDGLWRHVKLSLSGHVSGTGSTLKATPEGVFIYRSADGKGTFSVPGVKLLWQYGAHLEKGDDDFIEDDDAIDIRVMGIEMVYVPGGFPFNVGGGGGEGAFNSTTITTANSSLPGAGFPSGLSNTNPNYPNGFNAFYCMKYEISQRQFADFLNCNPSAVSGGQPGNFVMFFFSRNASAESPRSRNGIQYNPFGSENPDSAFVCNLDNDLSLNEPEDGQAISCNYITMYHLNGYLNWSGLRLMTDLEYEKACRGDQLPIIGEYAWGSTNSTKATELEFSGTDFETAANKNANVCCDRNLGGPMRVGSFAHSLSSRSISGASYYGIMDLTGNLSEPVIHALSLPMFTGLHGDGLNSAGLQPEKLWPGGFLPQGRRGYTFRGGSFFQIKSVSDVGAVQTVIDEPGDPMAGGRGVRTAPD